MPETSALSAEMERLASGRHTDPHHLLGLHDGVVRAFRPGVASMALHGSSGSVEMKLAHPAGFYEAELAGGGAYELEARYGDGDSKVSHRFGDPYWHWPTLGELDLHLIGQGRHLRLWEALGAHYRVHEGDAGTAFAVWAPNARAVRVVGDWNYWDGRVHPMRSLGSSGVWELFIPGVQPGARYKYEIVGASGRLALKADPMARASEEPPATASIVAGPPAHVWLDSAWMERRARADLLHEPMAIYELHLGSWRRKEDGTPLSYTELAEQLPKYVKDLGFTHVELMPVAEHPFAGSWGYQVTGYYAPTARYGSPDGFRILVDALHQAGIGVIIDWVPAHFPKDAFALARFDGTALYEHGDPREGEHPDWGTLVFNFGRNEVRNFLVANALYWLDQFHIDGLRVDAVASMLYRDYSRQPGEWVPNRFGGRENLEAVAFLKEVNDAVYQHHLGATVIAEESTAWPGVSRPTYLGGLGFGFKWNMGWMHDTLDYFHYDPIHRRYHQGQLTFGLVYAWSENFVLPLSHDEIVHGKGSLLNKMPGDRWQQLANLRSLYAWMWAHPGKKLLFMGSELAPEREWSHDRELDWWILDSWEAHRRVRDLLTDLNRLYLATPALWERDETPEGFQWLDSDDSDNSVLSFLRLGAGAAETGSWDGAVLCIANLTPVPRQAYRIGLPVGGRWRELLNTDADEWGGSGWGNAGGIDAEALPWHGRPWSASVVLPPLSVTWFTPEYG